MSRFGFLPRVVLAILFVGGCSSSESVAPNGEGMSGSNSNGSGSVGGEGGHAGVSPAGTAGSGGTPSTNEAGNMAGGANVGGSNDAGPSAEGSAVVVDSGHGNKILIYTKSTGFQHASTPTAAAAISRSAIAAGLAPEQSENTDRFVPATLSQYAAVILLATTGMPFGDPGTTQIQTLVDYVRAGGGLVAIENANHAYDDSVPYISLIGGHFNGHPAFGPDTCYKEGNHPSVTMLTASFPVTDEIYFINQFRADNQVVLRCGADKRPISWVRTEGMGRVFYTALGHPDESWTNPPLVDGHVIPGLLWTLGR